MHKPIVATLAEVSPPIDTKWYIKGDGHRGPAVSHNSLAEAITEAARLANTEPGVRYYILQATHVVVQQSVKKEESKAMVVYQPPKVEREITIRMPKESLEKWLAALRGGQFVQGRGMLQKPRSGADVKDTFCCLGVLEMALDGKVERHIDGESQTLPSKAWADAHNIEFLDKGGLTVGDRGIDHVCPYLPTLHNDAWRANDVTRCTFKEIADAIEACAEGV